VKKCVNLVELKNVMLKDEPTLAIGGVDTAENGPQEVCGTTRAREL